MMLATQVAEGIEEVEVTKTSFNAHAGFVS